jgi:multisubunit Na+/H+ antiporter MnhF subunit
MKKKQGLKSHLTLKILLVTAMISFLSGCASQRYSRNQGAIPCPCEHQKR